jgi:hypothetical protein
MNQAAQYMRRDASADFVRPAGQNSQYFCSVRKKTEQLGMPFGTASGRLKKLILFELVCRAGLNICFRCKKQIKVANELSIEHKRPWLNVSPKLFWDLDNIAFSHLKCNIGHGVRKPTSNSLTANHINAATNRTNSKKLAAPAGKSWCAGHKTYLPVEEFRKDRFRPDGLRVYCQACR